MPVGVEVTTGRIAAATNLSVPSGRMIAVGATARGTTKPTVVRSLTQYTQNFGERTLGTAHVYDTLELFFAEGGGEAVVARVLGPGATADSATMKNSTDADSVKFTAREVGGTGDLYVTVNTDKNQILVRRLVGAQYITLERFEGISVPAVLQNFEDSQFVRAAFIGEGAGDETEVLAGSVNLTGGVSDAQSAVNDSYIRAIATAVEFSPGACVTAPGYYPETGIAPLALAADKHLFITSGNRGQVFDEFAKSDPTGESVDGPENVLAVGPWVRVPNGDRLKTVPAEGYAAGARARAHADFGFWKSPAGTDSTARFVAAPAWPSGEAATTLNPSSLEQRIWANPILERRGRVTLADYRAGDASVSAPMQAQEVDTLANIRALVKVSLEQYLFRTIDGRGQLFSEVEGSVIGVLQPLADEGALFARLVDGEEVDPGYSVTVDSSNNTPETLAQNVLNVAIGVRLSPVAREIRVTIIQVPLTGAL